MKELDDIIKSSQSIVFLGGAGVSTESGIPDFRGTTGSFTDDNIPFETILSHTFYERYPGEFDAFYIRHMVYPNAIPNAAHKALANLEKMGKLNVVITQNIDGLHQQAGSKNVLELHGSIHRNTCLSCGKQYTLEEVLQNHFCCSCKGRIKPDVVLYEEPLDNDIFDAAIHEIKQCDTLIVGGTSLMVYPAAGLIRYFKGKHLILINPVATPYDGKATLIIREKIGEVLSFYQ